MFRIRNNRRTAFFLSVAVVSALVAGGCSDGAPASEDTPKIFAFSPFPADFNEVTRQWFNGLEQGAAEAGVDLEAKATAQVEDNTARYQSFIRSALVQQPDAIIVIPYNATAERPGLERIIKDGTPVLIMNQEVPKLDSKVAFVGADNVKAGQIAAKWMIEEYESGTFSSNKVGVLRSAPGITGTDDRLEGFKQGLEGSKLKVVSELTPNELTSAEGRTSTVDMLSAQPDLGALFCVTDILALGAAEALRAKNRLDVVHASIDASESGVKTMIDDGAIDAEVALHNFTDGKQSVLTLAKHLKGQDVPQAVDTGTTLVTADSAQEYLLRVEKESK